jgi:Carboxypeptidase regulatory-like domain
MISKRSPFVLRVGVVLLCLLVAIPLEGQATGAGLSGTVADVSGKPISDARISAKSVSTGRVTEVQADSAGRYERLNLEPGEYDVSVSAPGFTTTTTRVTVTTGPQTLDLTLRGLLSLEDLGFAAAQAQGSAADQARLDKRSHMLKLHQRYGLIAAVPLAVTVLTGAFAGGRSTSSSGRNLHAALGLTSVGLYSVSAYYAIAAPKIPGARTSGNTRWHKALAWVHGTGMILTPILGDMACQQRHRGEKVHGIASAHGGVAVATVAAYAAAILTESLK